MERAELEPDRLPDDRLPGLPTRLVQVLVAPGRLFRTLAREPRSWDALALGIVLAGLSNLLLPIEVWEQTIREQMTQFDGDMPVDLTVAARTGRVFGTIGVAVFWPILAVLTTGLYSLLFLFVFGYEGRFRQYFSMASHALLVAALGALLVAPLRIWTESAQFTLNLGAFFPMLEEGLAARFLGLLDLFNLWVYALVGLGASVIDGDREPLPSMGVSLGFALLLSLLIASFLE
ncbi:MAG: YIP1 family protein [Gemmatimonadota bacterium]